MDFIWIQHQFHGLSNLNTVLPTMRSKWKLMHSLERMFRDQLCVFAQLQTFEHSRGVQDKELFPITFAKEINSTKWFCKEKSDSFTQALKPMLFTWYNHRDFKDTQSSRNLDFIPELKDKRQRGLCKPHPSHSSFRSMNIWAKAEIHFHFEIAFVKWHLLASLAQRNLTGRRHWQILFSQCLTNDTEWIPTAYMESGTK